MIEEDAPSVRGCAVSSFPQRALIFLFKPALAAALLCWLLWQGRFDAALVLQLHVDGGLVRLFLCSAICIVAGLALMSWRFKMLLRCRNFSLSFSDSLRLTLIGSLFGALLPGLVGGDAVKAAYLCYHTPGRRVDALGVILMDRVVGVYSLFLLASSAMGLAWLAGSRLVESFTPIILTILAFLGVTSGVVLLIAIERLRVSRIIGLLISWTPVPVKKLLEGFREYLESPGILFVAVIFSLLNHCLVVLTFIMAGVLMDDGVPSLAHFVLDPLAMAMNMVPLTPGGLGVAESAFAFLFESAGSPNGAMIGLLGRIFQYAVFGLAGTIALVTFRARRPFAELSRPSGLFKE